MEAQSAQARLNTCRNTSELRSLLSELCSGLAEVLNVTTLCGNGRDNMMCVVDFFPGTPDLAGLAERIGGHVFGFNAIAIRLSPQSGFACPNGYPPDSALCSCTLRK